MIESSTPGYLDPSSVDAHAAPDGDVTVRIYTNGMWETVPDPRLPDKVSGVEESYNAGMFISSRTVKVRSGDLP